ncbi:hypothetical protein [Mucilaginibacter myungsuensis]|uniref:Uncharacterized protein n=1 Tax=Mucilaginibacter myungsuensis TaxID=649104 RepID=A0A929PW16_9SPHI|nr:hypothetical protein [Mucilaginibacter myungsuensis]MBE9662358.1 hypothetical protein [Mucilaginibacter myungsuensis]MDN3599205.1 hypothetical protein [Mucilaginibacter myungsuensis]
MEIPYAGRATVTDNFDQVEIMIPAYRNGFVVIFLTVWLFGWLFFEINAIETAMNKQIRPLDIFMDLWLIGWTIGGLLAIRMFIWMLFGKEIVKVGQRGTFIIKTLRFVYHTESLLVKGLS